MRWGQCLYIEVIFDPNHLNYEGIFCLATTKINTLLNREKNMITLNHTTNTVNNGNQFHNFEVCSADYSQQKQPISAIL